MKPLRLVVLGTLASNPYAGMAWMHMQIAGGLKRLGHDVYYFETTSTWPYDPVRQEKVRESDFSVKYLARIAREFGFEDRWAYRRSYSDKEWFGLSRSAAENLLAEADAVLNVSGATRLREEGLKFRRNVYYGTDPVYYELSTANGEDQWLIDEHDDFVTYGENIGSPICPIPPLPRLKARTRQPVLLDLWKNEMLPRDCFTTVGNWKQNGFDVVYKGEPYFWSKHHEFLKFIDVPSHVKTPIELALSLPSVPDSDMTSLKSSGWRIADALSLTTDPWTYRDYVLSSKGEFTVAKDQNVRLRSGWFSERSACYLAAGRPVITQDTGFGQVLPTGEGLFAFTKLDDIVAAFDAVRSNYQRHRKAALSIAEEHFRAEKVLAKLLSDLGLS